MNFKGENLNFTSKLFHPVENSNFKYTEYTEL